MRERDWNNPCPVPGDRIEADGLVLRCLPSGGAVLISGDLETAMAALSKDAPMIGLLAELPEKGDFALRIARDRALLCTPEPLAIRVGWHDGYALSLADDLYIEIDISGDDDGTYLDSCMSAQGGSPSAMAVFAEKACLVARARDAVRVWVPRADAAEVWMRLRLLSGA
ncbi:hypothetical protein [Roseovarius sp. MMSF_3281]|uniref:hypothetical protein n=1 Tax=Roseovarius sp. MMSF_3281 TaxID=3046694 RepID=UPI00273E5BCB|nr:hypothetical protein [Roseovarius sp. MMSF_3281]